MDYTSSYTSLPGRTILSSPFLDRALVSYGIIAYAEDTGRWLLVNRQHSPEFIILIRGSYRFSELDHLLAGLTVKELSKLKGVLGCSLDREQAFAALFKQTIDGSPKDKDWQYAWTRFQESFSYLQQAVQNLTGKEFTEWLWPKGRLSSNSEMPYRCAIREFSEETGIQIRLTGNGELKLANDDSSSSVICLNNTPLIESFRGTNGRIYETRCWVIVFSKEIPVTNIVESNRPSEIGARKWVSEEETRELLQPNKIKVLNEALRLLSKEQKVETEDRSSWRTVIRKRH